MAAKQDELQLGEDLFDFDSVLRDSVKDADELGAAFDAVLATTAGAPLSGFAPSDADLFAADAALLELEPAAPLPAPTHRVRPTPPPLGTVPSTPAEARPLPVRPVEAAASPAFVAAPPAAAAPGALSRLALSPALLAVLLALVAVNLGLAALVVRAMSAVQSTVVDVGQQVAGARAEPPPAAVATEPVLAPQADTRPEGPAALERAQAQLEAGAYERCRQTLYALLAVIDRVPAEVRGDVEARARFLLADSWRMEADALARGSEGAR
jgi:ribonuclease E